MTDDAAHREIWRELRRQSDRIAAVSDRLEEMSKADEIATAVAAELRADRRRRLTIGRKAAGALAALVLLVPAAHELVLWIGI